MVGSVEPQLKTLVLGGYGNFGARICRALAAEPSIALFVAGRDGARAEACAAGLAGFARGVALDLASDDLAQRLRALGIGLVIHTAGPFQQQGYGVAQACADAGAHYVDLADGRRFVCDFAAAMGPAFRAAGRVAISGASTVPALSSAVVKKLTRGWQHIDAVDICIAPAQTAPRGLATLEGVLDCCGADIAVWEEGRWRTRLGWSNPRPVRFARLRPRLGALCDIPDLELFPAHFAVRQRVMFRAALEVALTQRVFALLAALRARRLLRRPAALAGTLLRCAPMLDRMGSALGGMVVRVRGIDASGQPKRRAWHIAADDDHGPEIPCMAAILLARRLAQGEAVHGIAAGAYPALGLLRLSAFAPEFARWGMATDFIDDAR